MQRKISELQEVRELDSQAKAHMEDSFRLMGEEKEEKISVLQTQVRRGKCVTQPWVVGDGNKIDCERILFYNN